VARLVFITQVADPADPNLGATVGMIAALARRLDEVAVIADRGDATALPANVRLRTFGAASRPERLRRFVAALRAELEPRPLAVVAHMVPLYAVVAAPLVRPRRIPLVLWYAHWKSHLVLRTAHALATRVVSTEPGSFPFASRKLTVTGQATDVAQFTCEPRAAGTPFRVAALGRYSPGKRLEELVEGVRIAREHGVDARLDLLGTATTPAEQAYREELDRLVAGLDWASAGGPVPRTEIPALLRDVDAVATNFASPDRIVFEAAAACRPVLVSYAGFRDLVAPEWTFERGNPASFADALGRLVALGDEERAAIGRELRARVERDHSVDTWAEKVLALL